MKRRVENGDTDSSRNAAGIGIPVLNPFLLLGVWGLRPQRGRGAEPPWGFGGKAPNKHRLPRKFAIQCEQGAVQIGPAVAEDAPGGAGVGDVVEV